MKIENTTVLGFESALHGMRNPMNSWNKSDSEFVGGYFVGIGLNDNELAKKLIKAGPEHRKFLRLIHVSCFITLPRYIWQELDTYKVSTVRMSCSTMHKLGMTDLVEEDFQDNDVLPETLMYLNELGKKYRINKNIEILRMMKKLLPEGFLQSADYDMNYETAMNIYYQRKNHRMSEWSGKGGICEWIESLPMMNEWLNLK
jgi:hypothetical protein